MPSGYGYRVKTLDVWNYVVSLMNFQPDPQTVYVDVTYTLASSDLKAVKPVWLDIDQCGDSEYSIPAGPSDTHWDWRVNVEGKIVAIFGHLHDYGVDITATNQSFGGEVICDSVAGYGNDPSYLGHLDSMTSCQADPVALVAKGQTVRIHSMYDAPEPMDDVMGIMIAYIYRTSV
jgi:hypothetical protein